MLDNGLVNVPQYDDEQNCRFFQAQSLGYFIGSASGDELRPISLLGTAILLHTALALGDTLRAQFTPSFLGRLGHSVYFKSDRFSLGRFCHL